MIVWKATCGKNLDVTSQRVRVCVWRQTSHVASSIVLGLRRSKHQWRALNYLKLTTAHHCATHTSCVHTLPRLRILSFIGWSAIFTFYRGIITTKNFAYYSFKLFTKCIVSQKGCHQTHGGNIVKSQTDLKKSSFTTGKRRKFTIKSIYYFPPHLKYVVALSLGI